ncbi:MAG: fused MFS/spermidine synthase [Propionibacteriaceae bacterium]|nr:fused MFS/spermidine synthase [Propionibacteriaceae bacterium]
MTASDYLVPDPYNAGAWLVTKDGADQSWLDPAHPTRLEFDYMQRIAWLIDAWSRQSGLPDDARLRVVHVGGAGMSLARWVAATRPHSAQIVLEPDTAITAAVREFAPLGMHSGIKVRPLDGRTGVSAMPDRYADVVILDAFDHRQVPASLVSKEFMEDARRVLASGGLLAVNLIDAHPHDWSKRVVATISAVFAATGLLAEPSALKAHRVTNLVIGASQSPLPVEALTRRAAGASFPCTFMHDDTLSRWTGGAKPFTDADATPSPPRAVSELSWYG